MGVFWNCQGVLWPTPKWQASQKFTAHTPQQIRIIWGCDKPRDMEKHLAPHPILINRWWLCNWICGGKTCLPPAPIPPKILWNLRILERIYFSRPWPGMELFCQAQRPYMPSRYQRIHWNIPSLIWLKDPNQTSSLAPQASWNSLWRQDTSGTRRSG